ncbi:MAG: hypothetical protein WKG00_23300 [Polyangiaceae bacterium]
MFNEPPTASSRAAATLSLAPSPATPTRLPPTSSLYAPVTVVEAPLHCSAYTAPMISL